MSERTVVVIRNRALQEDGGRLPPLAFARLQAIVSAKSSIGSPPPSIADTADGYALTVNATLTPSEQVSAHRWIMREIDTLRGPNRLEPGWTATAAGTFAGAGAGHDRDKK